MGFKKYMHVERFGNQEVEGIELGECYIFPKIDGTNGSVWVDSGEYFKLCAGSRNRVLSLDNDNQGFFAHILENDYIKDLLTDYPNLRLFGEWLVPHSLRTYREEAWRTFYVFDVMDDDTGEFLPYPEYQELLENYKVEYIPPLKVVTNCDYERFIHTMSTNDYLLKDGDGVGEGIVIKNYSYANKYGRVTWAKIVTSEFKEKHCKKGVPNVKYKEMVEQAICDKYVTSAVIDKVEAKIVSECDGWSSKYIPRLLQTVFYDLVREEAWSFVKEHKNPTINFKTLNSLVIQKVKDVKPQLF